MVTIIIFLIVLAVLIVVHEFGHFIVAKKSGIRVDEFSLGFPPRLWSKKIGETIYSISAVPFGGYVKIFGENPDEESLTGPDSKRSFVNKNRAIQAGVLFAGVFFNFLLAWILISISLSVGVGVSKDDFPQYSERMKDIGVMITYVAPNSPAEKAGVSTGDLILSEQSAENLKSKIEMGGEVTLEYKRGDNMGSYKINPEKGVVSSDSQKFAIGIAMANVSELSLPIHLAVYEGLKFTGVSIVKVAYGLFDFIIDAVSGKADFSSVAGPIGIASLVGDAARSGMVNLLMFVSIISINLGVINLIPFPALDGGRLLFVLIESITRRRISNNIANVMNGVGFAILILLMVIVTYKDIVKFF